MRCHDYVRGMVGCRDRPLGVFGALVYGWLGWVLLGSFYYHCFFLICSELINLMLQLLSL